MGEAHVLRRLKSPLRRKYESLGSCKEVDYKHVNYTVNRTTYHKNLARMVSPGCDC